MNINVFFLAIISGLFIIFFVFKPIEQTKQNFDKVPVLELKDFKLSQLSNSGLASVTYGSVGRRFEDATKWNRIHINRYTVTDLDYTDNSKKYMSHMKSNNGVYYEPPVRLRKDNLLTLFGDVEYTREDGISFETQKARYNEKTKKIQSLTKYVSYMGENRATGSYLEYNSETGISKSKNVTINYKLKESK